MELLGQKSSFSTDSLQNLAARHADTLLSFLNDPNQLIELDLDVSSAASSTGSTVATAPEASSSSAVADVDPSVLRRVRKIVADVAGLPEADVDPSQTSLAALGLDSVSAIRICSEARKVGLQLSLRDVIEATTCAQIAAHSAAPVQEVDTPVSDSVPCLPGQIYQLASADAGIIPSHYVFALDMLEAVPHAQVAAAWQRLADTHTIIKARRQDDMTLHLETAVAPRQIQLEGDLREAIARATRGAMAPAVLLHFVSSDKSILVLALGHFLYDARSLELLLQDLKSAVAGNEISSRLPSLASFAAQAQQDCRSSASQQYWSKSLTGLRGAALADSRKVDKQAFARFPAQVKGIEAARARLLKQGVSYNLQTLVMLALAKTLAGLSGENAATIGLQHSGRSSSFPGLDVLPGPCTNIQPLFVKNTAGEPSRVAAAIAQDLAARRDFEQTSLKDIADWIGLPADAPLFDSVLNILWDASAPTTDGPILVDLGEPFYHLFRPTTSSPSGIEAYQRHVAVSLSIDVASDRKSDVLDMAVKYDIGRLSELQVKSIVKSFSEHIHTLFQSA